MRHFREEGTKYHLLGYHHNGFDRKPPVAVIKQVLERRAKEVNDENVV